MSAKAHRGDVALIEPSPRGARLARIDPRSDSRRHDAGQRTGPRARRPRRRRAFALARRTHAEPRARADPCRIGGFGGADGLAAFLRDERVRRADRRHPSLRRADVRQRPRGQRARRRAAAGVLAPGLGRRRGRHWSEVDDAWPTPSPRSATTPRRVFLDAGPAAARGLRRRAAASSIWCAPSTSRTNCACCRITSSFPRAARSRSRANAR